MIPVVIGTHIDSPWYPDCIASVRSTTRRKVLTHVGETSGSGYEPAALEWACGQAERFLFIQDSVTILSKRFWQVVDKQIEPAWLSDRPSMSMGIFDADTLRPLLPEEPVDKRGSIQFESRLHEHLKMPTIWPGVNDYTALRFEERHGRPNRVLGVEGIWEKHKGNWGQ